MANVPWEAFQIHDGFHHPGSGVRIALAQSSSTQSSSLEDAQRRLFFGNIQAIAAPATKPPT